MCIGSLFLRNLVVSSSLPLAGVLSFILGAFDATFVGRRCEQPGCYGRVRQVHDIKKRDKIVFKEKWKLSTSIKELCLGQCEHCGEIDPWRDRSRDRMPV